MPLRFCLAATLSLGLAAPALAGWTATGTQERRTYFVDADSITAPDTLGTRRVWVKVDLTQDRKADASYELQQWEVRCLQHQVKTLERTLFHHDGRMLDRRLSPFAAYLPASPGSLQRAVEQVACAEDRSTILVTAREPVDPARLVASLPVPVFDGTLPGVHYELLGPVIVRGDGQAQLYGKLWDEARKLGADAVFNAQVGRGGAAGQAARLVARP